MEYSDKYFKWQKEVGLLGGKLNKSKFQKFIGKKDILVDFGCGGGYLLGQLESGEKKGIEINESARNEAKKQGLQVVEKISDLPNNYADIIVSNHALEHVICPFEVISDLKYKLKKNGKIVFVVPYQHINEKYKSQDINQHLYTWNPMTLGTLFEHAGYKVQEVQAIKHAWPPMYKKLYNILGDRAFNTICRIYARFKKRYQVRVVAIKP